MKKTIKKEIDAENPEWTAQKFARSVSFSGLPQALQTKLVHGRGPQKAPTKVLVSLRLSKDVLDSLRASGRGWQSRADEALRHWVKRTLKDA